MPLRAFMVFDSGRLLMNENLYAPVLMPLRAFMVFDVSELPPGTSRDQSLNALAGIYGF